MPVNQKIREDFKKAEEALMDALDKVAALSYEGQPELTTVGINGELCQLDPGIVEDALNLYPLDFTKIAGTKSDFNVDGLKTTSNLGIPSNARLRESKDSNVKAAVAAYDKALQNYKTAWVVLGKAYHDQDKNSDEFIAYDAADAALKQRQQTTPTKGKSAQRNANTTQAGTANASPRTPAPRSTDEGRGQYYIQDDDRRHGAGNPGFHVPYISSSSKENENRNLIFPESLSSNQKSRNATQNTDQTIPTPRKRSHSDPVPPNTGGAGSSSTPNVATTQPQGQQGNAGSASQSPIGTGGNAPRQTSPAAKFINMGLQEGGLFTTNVRDKKDRKNSVYYTTVKDLKNNAYPITLQIPNTDSKKVEHFFKNNLLKGINYDQSLTVNLDTVKQYDNSEFQVDGNAVPCSTVTFELPADQLEPFGNNLQAAKNTHKEFQQKNVEQLNALKHAFKAIGHGITQNQPNVEYTSITPPKITGEFEVVLQLPGEDQTALQNWLYNLSTVATTQVVVTPSTVKDNNGNDVNDKNGKPISCAAVKLSFESPNDFAILNENINKHIAEQNKNLNRLKLYLGRSLAGRDIKANEITTRVNEQFEFELGFKDLTSEQGKVIEQIIRDATKAGTTPPTMAWDNNNAPAQDKTGTYRIAFTDADDIAPLVKRFEAGPTISYPADLNNLADAERLERMRGILGNVYDILREQAASNTGASFVRQVYNPNNKMWEDYSQKNAGNASLSETYINGNKYYGLRIRTTNINSSSAKDIFKQLTNSKELNVNIDSTNGYITLMMEDSDQGLEKLKEFETKLTTVERTPGADKVSPLTGAFRFGLYLILAPFVPLFIMIGGALQLAYAQFKGNTYTSAEAQSKGLHAELSENIDKAQVDIDNATHGYPILNIFYPFLQSNFMKHMLSRWGSVHESSPILKDFPLLNSKLPANPTGLDYFKHYTRLFLGSALMLLNFVVDLVVSIPFAIGRNCFGLDKNGETELAVKRNVSRIWTGLWVIAGAIFLGGGIPALFAAIASLFPGVSGAAAATIWNGTIGVLNWGFANIIAPVFTYSFSFGVDNIAAFFNNVFATDITLGLFVGAIALGGLAALGYAIKLIFDTSPSNKPAAPGNNATAPKPTPSKPQTGQTKTAWDVFGAKPVTDADLSQVKNVSLDTSKLGSSVDPDSAPGNASPATGRTMMLSGRHNGTSARTQEQQGQQQGPTTPAGSSYTFSH